MELQSNPNSSAMAQPNSKRPLVLIGAICGDIIGSSYEFRSTKDLNFELFEDSSRFTDDTVCSIAIADALISGNDFAGKLQEWCRRYPRAGYGGNFSWWFRQDDPRPYGSWGNGSAMRVSSVGAFGRSVDEVLELAEESAKVSHNHPEGIKGAQATALAIFLAMEGCSKEEIKEQIEQRFGYDLSRKYADIQPDYSFDVSCQGSVPEAIIAFIESSDYESAIRRAVALGGDADTQGAIAGGIAAAYYGEIPGYILSGCHSRLTPDIRRLISLFNRKLISNPNSFNKSPFMKSFKPNAWLLPQPVLVIGTYNADGTPNAMNAAWAGQWDENEIMISMGAHATTDNLNRCSDFTVAFATVGTMVAADYVGIASARKVADKMVKSGLTAVKASAVNAPVFSEFPMTLECRIVKKLDESATGFYLVAEILNILCDEKYLADDGKPDVEKMNLITFDPVHHGYIALGQKVGKAFHDGLELK